MDSKRGIEGVAPMGEVVDARSGVPESLGPLRESGEVLAGGEVAVDGVGQERMLPAVMPPAAEKVAKEQGPQDELQGDLVNYTTDIVTRDGERLEREWGKATDRLMDKTEDNPHLRLAAFDKYRWKYLGKRHNRVREGVS